MELDDVHTCYLQLLSELDDSRFTVRWQGPLEDRAKRSVCVGIDTADRLSELIVWESGETQLEFGDVTTGEVVTQSSQLNSVAELTEAIDRMKEWVTGD